MPPRDVLRILWSTSDPDAVALRLKAAGFDVESDGVLAFPSATIRLEQATDGRDRLTVEGGTEGPNNGVSPHPNGIEDVAAIGWATVDRERFLADATGGPNEDLPRDPHLGAFAVRHRGTPVGPQILVLEPDTEGRLVASLVRSDEGPAALYFSPPGRPRRRSSRTPGAAARRSRASGTAHSDRPSVLLAGPPWGPHLLVVERPSGGTIAP